jgi:hypothetical protein
MLDKRKYWIQLLTISIIFLECQLIQAQKFDTLPRSETWVATDDLGRKLPEHNEVGDKKPNKFVGLFYWTWQYQQETELTPKNVTKILKRHPNAFYDLDHPVWGEARSPHFWSKPLFGYYSRLDPWVLRKHAQMLADAGVDVVFFDCTNGSQTWRKAYMQLLKVWSEARKDGVQTPQVAFMLPFGASDGSLEAIRNLYNNLYKPGKYKDLWFYWEGKPLTMAYPDHLEATDANKLHEEIRDFFTFRPGQPLYDTGPERPDHWGWLEIFPQHGFVENEDGSYEQMTVGVSQNWSKERGLTAMNAPGSFGRSYTHEDGHSSHPNAYLYGFNFQEQWERALNVDPELIFITGWNEWIAGRYEEWQGQANAFPDQFDTEHSRDIEPMQGGFKDNYYYQMVANIRRFKGVSPFPYASEPTLIRIDGQFEDWTNVEPEFYDHKGDTVHRNFRGWKGTHYENKTGRNDILRSKAARDDDALYFYVETARPLTSSQGPRWMRLFIDMDRNKKTGWQGYDFVVNRVSPGSKAIIEKSDEDWNWSKVGKVEFEATQNSMELKIPRALLDIEGKKIDIEFKWSDNVQEEGNSMDFWIKGDAAPSGRFNYRYAEE